MKSPITWLVLLVIALVGVLGYTAGRGGLVFNNPLESALPSPISSTSITASSSPLPSSTPIPSPQEQTIQAGGILSFPKYQVIIPANWSYEKTSMGPSDQKLTLKYGEYEIAVMEGAFGGNVCLYPGDAPFEGPSQTYMTFVELTTIDGLKLRRSSSSGSGFTVCQFAYEAWQAPTPYGHVSIKTPNNPTTEELANIDTILKTLKKL